MDSLAPDAAGDALVGPAVALVGEWLSTGSAGLTRGERRGRRRMQLLTRDERSLAFTMAFCDRVLRPQTSKVAAGQLRAVASGPLPPFLTPLDKILLRAGAAAAQRMPGVVMPLTRRRLRQIVGDLVVDSADPTLARQLRRLRRAHFAVNVNLLGESVLGDEEAQRRLAAIAELLGRGDVDYVSVKASAVASQLNLWGYDATLERVKRPLRQLYRIAAAAGPGRKFVNLDMEEYRDLRLTVDAFTGLLSEPALRELDAGIVLQAYLPDSFDVLREIVEWACERRAGGGGRVKVRIVKGANLAMETVDAALHGFRQAPYATKAETDANYKRMIDWALTPERVCGTRIGVASHNLFDVAWARLLAEARGVSSSVEMEMLQGMAPGIDRAVLAATGSVRLYTPVVAAADFDTALAYLFRRLEENSQGENFLRSAFDLDSNATTFGREQARFETAVADRWTVGSRPRRHTLAATAGGFANSPDTDPTDTDSRRRVLQALTHPQWADLPPEVTDTAGIDSAVAAARHAAEAWGQRLPEERRRLLIAVAARLTECRSELLAVMAQEAAKTLAEGDGEVSEAIDMAAYYAEQIPGGRQGDLAVEARFRPFGVVLVTPPWNFPLAIPMGGVCAALAAGNAVVLKAPPQTPRCARGVAEAVWEACREMSVPPTILQYVRCPEEVVGEHLVCHPDVGAIVLTGARETAQLFHRLAPATLLFAETSGKNALVIMPDADLDLAAEDLVRSAFGHAGQKCSAASLAVCVGDVYTSKRFRAQLLDAARSLVLGPATDPATTMAPLIGPPGAALTRALTTLDPGEEWLLEPRPVAGTPNLWSPGIKVGVRPGSWFHQTECFGPVLALMPATDLEEALAVQNGTPFGLTGGIHTLDPQTARRWLAGVQVGNAYVNRVITGAVVQRQPFGGWKESVVGPGAKAGGRNYVAQLGEWFDGALPTRGEAPHPHTDLPDVAELDPGERAWLEAALRSDAWWQRHHFGIDHDPTGLFCEANVFLYRPLGRMVLRLEPGARRVERLRVLAAARLAGCEVEVSGAPGSTPAQNEGLRVTVESTATFMTRMAEHPPERIRVLGAAPAELLTWSPGCYLDSRVVVADAGVEGLRYRREQSISRTLHRFGNLIREP